MRGCEEEEGGGRRDVLCSRMFVRQCCTFIVVVRFCHYPGNDWDFVDAHQALVLFSTLPKRALLSALGV